MAVVAMSAVMTTTILVATVAMTRATLALMTTVAEVVSPHQAVRNGVARTTRTPAVRPTTDAVMTVDRAIVRVRQAHQAVRAHRVAADRPVAVAVALREEADDSTNVDVIYQKH